MNADASGALTPVFQAAADHDLPLVILAPGQVGLLAPYAEKFPGLTIVLIVLCVNFVGDGLRDALDPTQRRVRA